MKIRFAFLLLMVGVVATATGCSNRPLNALNPCTINGVVQNVPVNPQRALDVLFIIDDSPSMLEEQAKLAEQVPRLVNLLLTGGIDFDDSSPVGEFPAVESLHVGIVTPDLGYSTDPPQTQYQAGVDFDPTPVCERNNGNGKAGFMQISGLIDADNNPSTPRVACEAQTPPTGTTYLNYSPDVSFTAAEFVEDVECVTGQTDGCGFEQQLEAILAQDRNGANGGFNREDALLAVILITDEDDCSTTDPRIFDTVPRESNPYQGPFTTEGELQFNLRCWAHSEALQSVQRYVEGITALKADPSQVVFAAITGIPEKSSLDRENFDSDEERYDAILADSDMTAEPDPDFADEQTQELRPACTATDGSGAAVPGRRIVDVAKGLAGDNTGVGTVVESICAADYSPALNAIVDRIAAALRQLCLPRALTRNSDNLVGCEVREVQPQGVTCAEAGRGRETTAVGTEDGREVCRIEQLAASETLGVPEGLGWFYDDFTAETTAACSFNDDQQRVSFTAGSAPVSGARIRFECLQAAPPKDVDIGWPCVVNTDDCERSAESLDEQYDRPELELECDPGSNTCQLTCDLSSECPGGFSCFDSSGDGNTYCINPTCTLN